MLLVDDEEPSSENASRLNSETNRTLHCMAAHLHRYGSELALLQEIVQDIKRFQDEFHQNEQRGLPNLGRSEALSQGLGQLTSQLASISRFRDELRLKTDNVLALVSSSLLFVCHALECYAHNHTARR